MDIQMPNMDGTTATTVIRKMEDPVKRNIPIIALTAQASIAEADKCLKLGMSAYMSKPFKAQELKKKIIELVTKTNNNKEMNQDNSQLENTIYDLTHLTKHADGDKIFLEEIYTEFLKEMPKKLKEIQSAIKEKDVKHLSKIFHSLHGIFSTFGMQKAIQILDTISPEIKQNGVTNNSKKQIDELELLINEAMENLKVELSNLK